MPLLSTFGAASARGFRQIGHPAVILLTVSSFIGDMNGNGGLGAAFDGNDNQAWAASAKSAISTGGNGYVGADFSAIAKTIDHVVWYGGNNYGCSGNGGATTSTLKLYVSNIVPANSADGTLLTTDANFADPLSRYARTISSGNLSAWKYVWLRQEPGGTNPGCCCAEMYIYGY